jgi:type II secretory pathway pseudopilin PulG
MTILEIATVVVIIGILASLLLPAYSGHRARYERVQCMANLRSLHVAASGYLQAGASWPQIPSELIVSDPSDYAKRWVQALGPFGAPRQVWTCPTHERDFEPEAETEDNYRSDYIASPFNEDPASPHRWVRYPWFFEQGNFHKRGSLIIFNDGSIMDLADYLKKSGLKP